MTKTTGKGPVTRADLETKHLEQEALIASLRAKRADAVLAGETFDKASLRDAEDELWATEEALAEFDRREKAKAVAEAEAEAALTEAERRKRVSDRLMGLLNDRAAAVDEMEAAIRSKRFGDALCGEA